MRPVIFIELPEPQEGAYYRLEYIVDPDEENPDEILAIVREFLRGKPLGGQSQPLLNPEWNARIVDFEHPHYTDVEKMKRWKVESLIPLHEFEEEIRQRVR